MQNSYYPEVINFIKQKAYNLRYWSVVLPSRAGSGHTTSCLSAADIVAVLFFHVMRYDPYNFNNPDNDRFILSKGHASPLLYAAWRELGLLTDEEMLTYRSVNSALEGHPTFRFAYAEAATGSLGIGLSIGVGEALSATLDRRTFRTYVLMGDSESAEGSVWEAVQLAAYYKLSNLVCCIDVNNLGQTDETMLDYAVERYCTIARAFGWHAVSVDGHDVKALVEVFEQIESLKGPVMVVAKTIKGYGLDCAGINGYHGKAFTGEKEKEALAQLADAFAQQADRHEFDTVWLPRKPVKSSLSHSENDVFISLPIPAYEMGDMIAPRKAFGQALALLGDTCNRVVSLDAEVKNSTYAELFEDLHPDRFFQCFVAEQNMVGMGVGFERRGKIPFISTFSSFFSRAHDQIRMAGIGKNALRLVGSHCGVSIGQDGPSQMGLEDIAMIRCVPDSVVVYPCDAVSTSKLVEQMARYNKGISYLRTTRMELPVIYSTDEEFPLGGCKVLKQSPHDIACIIGAGVTLREALKAYEILAQANIYVSVIDLYSVKPLDTSAVISVALSSDKKIITVEDHYQQGGIGEAVALAVQGTAIVVHSLAVMELPRSGKPDELLALYGIDSAAIIKLVNQRLKK